MGSGRKMVIEAGLSRHFFIIIVVIILCKAKTTPRSMPFERLSVNKERLSLPYKTMEKASSLQCSAACANEEECLAFNHHAVAGSCELIDSSGLQQERQATEDSGWKVYEKGTWILCLFCFWLRLSIPFNNFSVMSGRFIG